MVNIKIMLKNKLNWIDFKLETKNTNFTSELFKNKLNIFWREIMENKLTENQHIWLLFRLKWDNNEFATIGKLVKLNKEDENYLFEYIMRYMEDKTEYYKEQALKSIIFSYTIRKGLAKEKVTFDNINFKYQNYKDHKLPITMNPLEYGDLIRNIGNVFVVQINKTHLVDITQEENRNIVKLFINAKELYEYIDIKINDTTFERYIDNKKFTFKNGELILLTIDKSTNFIKPLNLDNKLTNKFITLDIETYQNKDGIMIPYCICKYDGVNSYEYKLINYKSSKDMIIDCIKDIMVRKYDNYQVYTHNLSGFDGIFLLKILVELGKVKPLIHNEKIIMIGFKYNNYDITFKDSKQLLLISLRNLAKAFGVETQKSIFPYTFVNENNLNYIGEVPNINYFDNLNQKEYNNYSKQFNNNWNLINETIKYCFIDCISLYQIIFKFSVLIFELFKINIHKYPTLSSLAFAIFKSHFLSKNTIPQLSGQIAKDIRLSYTGGAVDMYIPKAPEGVKLFGYDVNSLYPFVMKEYDMPTGKPIHFLGDIRKVDSNAFGFFYCRITAPNNLKHPILQTHVKVNKGKRTIAPLGQWESMIFSAEMDNAKKYGYKFEILWGYKFKPKNIFKGYIECLYQLRLKFDKSNPLNLIAKLLLNSLYGRFGMKDRFPDIIIFNDKKIINQYLLLKIVILELYLILFNQDLI